MFRRVAFVVEAAARACVRSILPKDSLSSYLQCSCRARMSNLVASVDSALIRVKAIDPRESSVDSDLDFILFERLVGKSDQVVEMKIGLMNLKALHLVSRLSEHTLDGCFLDTLFCPILERIEIILDMIIHRDDEDTDVDSMKWKRGDSEFDVEKMAMLVHKLGEKLDKKLSLNGTSSPLTVDEVAGITNSGAENASDFLFLADVKELEEHTDAFEVIDAFLGHMRLVKDVLVFSGRAGVELEDSFRSYIHPIAVIAARVFIMDDPYREVHFFEKRLMQIRSNCLEVNGMAMDPLVHMAYSHTLAMARLSSTLPHLADETVQNLLHSLVSFLWDALRRAPDSAIKDGFISLYQSMRFLRDVVKQQATILDEEICVQLRVLTCDAGVQICSFHQADADKISDLVQCFDVLGEQVDAASPTMHTMQGDDELGFHDFTTTDGNEMAPQVVGFHSDEVESMLDRLFGGSKHLRIIPVCGMAGLGKTTFAKKLHNHPNVLRHFGAHAWVTVSQELDKNKVLRLLLTQIQPGNYSSMSEDDLANKVRQSLKGRRYLILLDDVWSPKAWNSLKASFPDDIKGSRIILTSRSVNIIHNPRPDQRPHLLHLREDGESVEILQAKLKHKKGWSSDLGMKVARICKGLPLTLVIVSGLLATTEQQGWDPILDRLSSGNGVSGAEQCNIALELGYRHLPDYLQTCFLYFGAFPEDEETCVKTVIRLWMAEGFVIQNESERVEDVGLKYVEELIERNLVIVGKNRSLGGAKTVHIHDLLHGYCRSKMKQENLLHLFQKKHDRLLKSEEMRSLQRLVIHTDTDPIDFKEARLFCPDAISLLFCDRSFKPRVADISFIIQIFQHLKVLRIGGFWLQNGIPNEIGLLTQLSYLSLSSRHPIIPPSIGNLSNLETFIATFHADDDIAFPSTLWNLQKLRCLYIKSRVVGNPSWGCFTLPVKDIESSPSLLVLETLHGVVFDGSMVKQLQKFPHIRRLKCTIKATEMSMDIPTELESLTMRADGDFGCGFGSTAENLRKLRLDEFKLGREEIGIIGKFPNLEVLKLYKIDFMNHTLEMGEEEFPKLRSLEFYGGPLKRWITCDDELPQLQKLVFQSCYELVEIPSWLETSSALEEIQVIGCSDAVESLARDIERTQEEYGNMIKLHISRLIDW